MKLSIKKIMGWLISLILLLVVVSVAIWIFQSKFVYYPDSTLTIDPSQAGLSFEDIYLKTSDGVKIHGWFVPNDKSKYVLIFCHGNGGNISGRVGMVRDFHGLGLNVFIFDYHGYGKSEGSPSEKKTYMDVEASWDWLTERKGYSKDNIIVLGKSLGGAVALYIAEKKEPKALILDSAFLSVPDMAKLQFPFLPVFILPIYQYPNKNRIKNIKCPVLIIHSSDDELIPYEHGKSLFESAKEPKTFLKINGSHNDGYFQSKKEYLKAIETFVSK